MSSFSVLTESELDELLHPGPLLSNSSIDFLPPVRLIDGVDQLRSVSTLDLICACFYIFFTIFGLLANCWVLHLVIHVLRCRESRSTISVPIYIFTLTFLNIVVLCGLPFTVLDLLTGQWWPRNGVVCTTYWIIELMNKTMASFILSLLSISCYFAVCHPKRTQMYNNVWVALVLIVLGFILVFAQAIPIYRHSGLFYLIKSSNDQAIVVNYGVKCVFQPEEEREQYQFTLCCFLCGYAAPAVLMFLCYGAILRRVARKVQRSSAIPRPSISNASSLISGSNTVGVHRGSSRFWRVAKSSAILVIFYLFSWTPYWTVMMTMMHQTAGADDRTQILASIAIVLHVLPYVNCAGSPLLYTLLNKQMRKMYEQSRRRRKSSVGQNGTQMSRRAPLDTMITRQMSEVVDVQTEDFRGQVKCKNRISLVSASFWVNQNNERRSDEDVRREQMMEKRRKTVCVV